MATLDLRQSTIFSRLRGLLEVTRLLRTGDELPDLLLSVARTVSDSLAFRTVVVNLYRREWNDFVVSTVYGSEGAREALLGQVRQVDDWEPLLDQRFLQRGAYVVPSGEFDWDEYSGSVYTPNLQVSDDPGAWHPDDALFVPMRGSDGRAARDSLRRRAALGPQAERRRDRRARRRLRARSDRSRGRAGDALAPSPTATHSSACSRCRLA